MSYQSLSHSKWDCKYHLVFIPKCRRKKLYGKIRNYLPPVTEGALDGITWQAVIELAVEQGISVSETVLTPYDLYTAEECFLTGTGAKLIPVTEIDRRMLESCPGEIYQRLSAAYASLVLKETT